MINVNLSAVVAQLCPIVKNRCRYSTLEIACFWCLFYTLLSVCMHCKNLHGVCRNGLDFIEVVRTHTFKEVNLTCSAFVSDPR